MFTTCDSKSRKDLDDSFNRSRQHVNFFFCVVESKRSARGCRHIEPLHHRLRAMMPGTHGDAFLIEDGANVVRMDIIDNERQDTELLTSCADDAYTFDCA